MYKMYFVLNVHSIYQKLLNAWSSFKITYSPYLTSTLKRPFMFVSL